MDYAQIIPEYHLLSKFPKIIIPSSLVCVCVFITNGECAGREMTGMDGSLSYTTNTPFDVPTAMNCKYYNTPHYNSNQPAVIERNIYIAMLCGQEVGHMKQQCACAIYG